MNERGLVEVPENAIRDEPIAFGLTAVQLGICGVAALVGAAVNLLPVWEPLRMVIVLLTAGPIVLAGVLPIRGEPAYRWLLRAVRYLRSRKAWRATIHGWDKWLISETSDNVRSSEQADLPAPLARRRTMWRQRWGRLPRPPTWCPESPHRPVRRWTWGRRT